ncbi:translation initiation factor IF-2 [Coturnix japonica]|uniref:translation initiation factor IF-2 n=1 Tax=Coturnix japonica TaxID=93934 RepID=UPI0013A5C4DA|nr:translation initiation factor IF-2 [Coturnix japonica]
MRREERRGRNSATVDPGLAGGATEPPALGVCRGAGRPRTAERPPPPPPPPPAPRATSLRSLGARCRRGTARRGAGGGRPGDAEGELAAPPRSGREMRSGGNRPRRCTEGYAGNDVTYRAAAGLRGAGDSGARRKAGGEGMPAAFNEI